jgi:hypothetical protein
MTFVSLAEWLARQPKGALSELMYRTRLSWSTVCRARDGKKVRLGTARRISRATGGEVPVTALTNDEEAFYDESRAVA